ncbi:MAG: leucine-rich repeat domain-containing protein [Candidatus Thorarchaeota archaeon]
MTILYAEVEDGTLEEFEVDDDQTDIFLEYCDIISIDISPLSSSDDLVKLSLIGNAIEQIDLTPLSTCPNLQFLWLKENELETIDLSPISSCLDLRELSITGNLLKEVDLSPLRNCTKLELLGLGTNRLKNIDLEPLRACVDLDVLYLYDNRFKTIDLSPISSCPRFKGLYLYRNDLTEFNLTPLSVCVEFEILEMQENQLQEIDLSPLSSCVRLSTINLEENMLTGIDLRPLRACTKLRRFGLRSNRIQTLDLSPLVVCELLEELYLQENELKKLDLTPLGLSRGLGSGSFDFNFAVSPAIQWIETLFSEENFWPLHNEMKIDIRFDAPSFSTDLTVIFRILNEVITQEPKWKTTHLLHNALSLLGLDWVGMMDTDTESLLKEFLMGQNELDQGALLKRVISLVSAQIDSGSTTIGLDIDRMAEYPELAVKFDRVADLRRRELEQVDVIETDLGLDLRPLWLTAHGFQILSALGLGTSCGADEAGSIQTALSDLGFTLQTTHSGSSKHVTDISLPLRDYIWHLADYKSDLRQLAIVE